MNEIASERAAVAGNAQLQPSLPQFSQQPHLPMVAPNLYQPHFPQAAMTSAAAMQQPSMLAMGTYPQQTMMTGQPMVGQPPPGAQMGVFRPPPSHQQQQPFVAQPAPINAVPPMNYPGPMPSPYAAAAMLQQMQQDAAASRRPLAFVDPTASPMPAPIPRMAHSVAASNPSQPTVDDPFRPEHGHGNGVITFYVSPRAGGRC